MSWIQTVDNLQDQMTILIGSAIRLLCGEVGVFVISNEAFDPRSGTEYVLYRLEESALAPLLSFVQESLQPTSRHPLIIEMTEPEFTQQLRVGLPADVHELPAELECCSLAVTDQHGPIGVLHFLRPVGQRSCLEQTTDTEAGERSPIFLFIAQLAASLRFALQAQSLVKEQDRLAAIFHHSTEGLLTVDNALRIIDFNPAMERLTGWHESEVLGQFYFTVLRPRDRQGNELGLQDSPILQCFAGQPLVNRDMIITTRDGQSVDVRVTASCVRSPRGEPVSGILTVHDISREREQEEQRSTFISVISHELQTPIAIIKGYASTLARAGSRLKPDVVRSRLYAIEDEADRLNKLVGNLLYASRIQAQGLQMDVAPLQLEPLIHRVIRRLQVKYPDLDIALDISPDLPTVMADRDRIEEVLQNLLDNAIKYSPDKPAITIAARATSNDVIVSVRDAGMGISLRDQEQIFQRFRRLGDPLAQSTPGAGLGLYICRAIVEAHGGRIWVDSALRQGSTFSFSLPREEQAHLPMVVF